MEPNWVPITLYPKQRAFLELPHREALYGGAAGGGKSFALLAGALAHVNHPQWSALLIRRSRPDLTQRGGLMDIAHEWLTSTAAKWNHETSTWRFPSGATLRFGYLESDKDRYQYQGGYYSFIGFDELTQHKEDNYLYVVGSRGRKTTDSPFDVVFRNTTNPGGDYHVWVQERFVPEGFTSVKNADQIVYEVEALNEVTREMEHRAFVPADLEDNFALDREDYLRSLALLDPVTRAQLLEGDWIIRQKGDVFPMWDEKYHVITWGEFERVIGSRHIPESWTLGVGMDWGSTEKHPFVVVFVARGPEGSPFEGKVFVHRMLSGPGNIPPREVAHRIIAAQKTHREFERTLLWIGSHEQKAVRDTMVMDHGLPFGSVKPDRVGGIDQLKDYLQIRGSAPHPFRPLLRGTPSIFFLVDDQEITFSKTDAGLARLRLEMSLYHYDENGKPYNKELNDAIDALRFIAGKFFIPIARKTREQELREFWDSKIANHSVVTVDISPEQAMLQEMSMRYNALAELQRIKQADQHTHPLDSWGAEVWKEQS